MRSAFTLIELLVVVSIIALLIAILLPALSSAREAARTVQCLSNTRQIAMGSYAHATDRDQQLPIAGRITNNGPGTRAGLGSLGLVYYDDANPSPAPWPAVLNNEYLGIDMDLSSYASLEADMLNEDKMVYFRCPSDTNNKLARTLITNAYGVFSPLAPISYGQNGSVLGWEAAQPHRALGDMEQVLIPSKTFLFGDLQPREALQPFATVYTFLGIDQEGTLWESFNYTGPVRRETVFDKERHGDAMNIAFADGHASTVRFNQAELEAVYVAKGLRTFP